MNRRDNLLIAIVLAVMFVALLYISSTHYKTPDQTTTYTVQPGDTLWGIAEEMAPGYHTGNVVLRIRDLNDLEDYIRPGDVLEVPCEVRMMEATAYTWTGNRTATGTWPSRGTVAVDPSVIPMGTKLHIEGYGEAIAADTGGAIKGEIIDLYMDSENDCFSWGRRQVEVRIIE